jgi:DNA-binding NtrC family response regulator
LVEGRGRLRQHSALIVDPDEEVVSRLRAIAEGANYRVFGFRSFECARGQLRRDHAISTLVTNVRLGQYNGIHLVYLGKLHHPDIHALVYGHPLDAVLAREAQRASAFYQHQGLMMLSLGNFLRAGLPSKDRRTVSDMDRRATFRGGRRTTDVATQHFAVQAI